MKHKLCAPCVVGLVVLGEVLHHGEVASEEYEKNRLAGQLPVPDSLKFAGAPRQACQEPRHLVQYNNGRGIGGQGRCQEREGRCERRWTVPLSDGCARKVGLGDRPGQVSEFIDQRCTFSGGEVHRRDARPAHELCHQRRLTHATSPPKQDRLPLV